VDDYLVRIQTQTCDSGVPESLLVGIMVGGLRPDLAAIDRPDALSIISPSFIVVNTFIFKLCCVLDEHLVVWSLFMVKRVIKFT
jgi:hypothetical protein